MYIVEKHKIYFEPLANFSCMFREQTNLIFNQQLHVCTLCLSFNFKKSQNNCQILQKEQKQPLLNVLPDFNGVLHVYHVCVYTVTISY